MPSSVELVKSVDHDINTPVNGEVKPIIERFPQLEQLTGDERQFAEHEVARLLGVLE